MECPGCGGSRDIELQAGDGTQPGVAVHQDPDCQRVWEVPGSQPVDVADDGPPGGRVYDQVRG